MVGAHMDFFRTKYSALWRLKRVGKEKPEAPGVQGVDGFQIYWLQMIADIYKSNHTFQKGL